MRRTLASIGLMAVGLMVIGFAYFRAARTVEVRAVHPGVPPADWEAYVSGMKATAPTPGPEVTALMGAWRDLNRAEADALVAKRDPGQDAAYRAALTRFRAAAVGFARTRGGLALAQLGRWEGLRLINVMQDLLRYAHHRGASPAKLLEEQPRPQPVQAYVDVGGGFALFAARGGFIERGDLVEARYPMLQAVFVDHWVTLVRAARPIDAYVRPDETSWLLRWRLEFQREGDLAQRLAAADTLTGTPGYPAHLNAGVALFNAGRYQDAVSRFRRSKARLAPVYERMARRRLEQ